jgi:hypothetical protein
MSDKRCLSCGDEIMGRASHCGPCGQALVREVADSLGVDPNPDGSVVAMAGVLTVGHAPARATASAPSITLLVNSTGGR